MDNRNHCSETEGLQPASEEGPDPVGLATRARSAATGSSGSSARGLRAGIPGPG